MQIFFVELQRPNEPLKALSGNLNRMNSLLTVCNKRLDNIDKKLLPSLRMMGSVRNLLDLRTPQLSWQKLRMIILETMYYA
jgi:hypothetical protein